MPFPALHERIGVSWCGEDDVAVGLEQKGRLVRHASRVTFLPWRSPYGNPLSRILLPNIPTYPTSDILCAEPYE